MKQVGWHCKRHLLLLAGTFIALIVFCEDYDIVFYQNGNVESMSVDSIDSITFPQDDSSMLVALCNRKPKLLVHIDSVKFMEKMGDTIQLLFQEDLLNHSIENHSIFGDYKQNENRVTCALLHILNYGGSDMIDAFIEAFGGEVINSAPLIATLYKDNAIQLLRKY